MTTRALLACVLFAAAVWAQPYPGAPTFTRSLTGLDIRAMVAAPDGSIAVGGTAKAAGLPVSSNAIQAEFNPTTCGVIPGPGLVPNPCGDAYFARFDRNGALVYGSYLGGVGQDELAGLALRANGDLYIAGISRSPEIAAGRGPFVLQLHADGSRGFVTPLSADPDRMPVAIALSKDGLYVAGQFAGAPWLAKLDPDSGARLFTVDFSTTGYETVADLAIDGAGNVYLAGAISLTGVFVTRVAPDGRVLSSTTFGASFDSIDRIAVASNGDVLVAGTGVSRQNPVGSSAGWLTRLPADLSAPISSRLIDIYTNVSAILPQKDGTVVLFGNTQSNFFQVTAYATERCPAPAIFARLSADGSLRYASFLTLPGGERSLLRASITDSTIAVAGAASVTSFTAAAAPLPTRLCAVQSASFGNFLTYTGEYVTIFGSGLAPRQVLVNGTPAELAYVSPGQVNILIPPLPAAKTLRIEVDGAGAVDAPAVERAPGLFRIYGTYLAATLPGDPRAGGAVTFFGNGFGPAPHVQIYFDQTEAPVRTVMTEGGLTRIEVSVPNLPPGRYPVNFLSDSGFQLGLVEIVLQ